MDSRRSLPSSAAAAAIATHPSSSTVATTPSPYQHPPPPPPLPAPAHSAPGPYSAGAPDPRQYQQVPQQQQQQQQHQQNHHHTHQQPPPPPPPPQQQQQQQQSQEHPPPPSSQPQQQQQYRHPQHPLPPAAPSYAHHPSPHPPTTTASSSATSTPQQLAQHPPIEQLAQQQQQQQQQHHYHHYPPPSSQSSALSNPQQQPPYAGASLPPAQGNALPPIQSATYAPPASTAEQHSLPPFRHPSAPQAPHIHEHRDPSEYAQPSHYQHHNSNSRSGHATPASVGHRSYSHDSAHHQRTPTTPVGPSQQQQAQPPPPGPPPPQQQQQQQYHQPHLQETVPQHQHQHPHQQPPGPPGPPPPQAPPQMDHGGPHHGYPPANGVMHGVPPHPPPPPPPQQQAPHHEPHAQYMHPMMDGHHAYAPQAQQIYGPTSFGPASSQVFNGKRKQMRATQACEQCRQRKQKCDEGSPCSFCKENSLTCQYRDTPPAKTDKNTEKLVQLMEAQALSIQEFTARMERSMESFMEKFGNRLDRMESLFEAQLGSQLDIPFAARKEELADHRTAPHKLLLLWPSVRPLLDAAHVTYSDSYVMEAEDRGVLRLWTRGEGIDEHDGTQPGGATSPAQSEGSTETSHTTTPRTDGQWGIGFPQTPNSEIRRSEPYGWGGLKANGEIDLDPATVNSLFESYMTNIHIMHPFLDKRRLRKMFDSFIKQYSTAKSRATFVSIDSERPMKRARTTNGVSGSFEESARKAQTERSPGNAVIWLVLALGKICQWRQPLPAIAPDSMRQMNTVVSHQLANAQAAQSSSPAAPIIKQSPMSPKSTPGTANPTPPSETHHHYESRSRRQSYDGTPPAAGPKNLDVVPGIAYYAKAAEILGDQGDGNDLVHAQMFLLAGLYKGQLGRVKESMSWFTIAGRAIMILLDRYKLYNESYWSAFGDVRQRHEQGQSRIKDTRHALIVLASWTCLQLETDILAELRLPASNIQNIENMLLMPNRSPADESYEGLEPDGRQEDYDNILLYYTAQLFLRRRLNQLHRQVYGPECLSKQLSEVKEILQGHEDILNGWRSQLPPMLRWEDDDPPPSDILAARLRAKYWGARYVNNRPFLDYALHIMPYVQEGKTVEESARDGHGNPRDKADIHLFKAIKELGNREIWSRAEQCILAAMQSTVAFDGVPGRLIVTNIHGTAHAQFGNVLVLSAAYNNTYLTKLVPRDRFVYLINRTIKFLRRLAPISPTCAADCGILEKFNNYLFGAPDEIKHVYVNEGIEPMSYRSDMTAMHDHSSSSSATNSFHGSM